MGLLSWYLSLSLPKNVLTSPRKSALAPEPTQGRFRNLWLRSGAMFQLLNLALLKTEETTTTQYRKYKATVNSLPTYTTLTRNKKTTMKLFYRHNELVIHFKTSQLKNRFH